MKILRLPIKKKWYDMILSGEKKEEYRAISKHWRDRLIEEDLHKSTSYSTLITAALPNNFFKKYTHIEFSNGYGASVPKLLVELKSINVQEGNEDWGAMPETYYFTHHLGKIVSVNGKDFKRAEVSSITIICNQLFVKDSHRNLKHKAMVKCVCCGEQSNFSKPFPFEMQDIIKWIGHFEKLHSAKGCNEKKLPAPKWAAKKIEIGVVNP